MLTVYFDMRFKHNKFFFPINKNFIKHGKEDKTNEKDNTRDIR